MVIVEEYLAGMMVEGLWDFLLARGVSVHEECMTRVFARRLASGVFSDGPVARIRYEPAHLLERCSHDEKERVGRLCAEVTARIAAGLVGEGWAGNCCVVRL
jgi:hypothetical protein